MTGRVLILHAGGTIGMAPSPQGYKPVGGFAQRLRERLDAQAGAALPEFDLIELAQPIDSADLRPSHWPAIARALVERWHDYDGFVVLHGTDTMAWSASALSFMLRGCDKPVIFTGAQIPLAQPRSDALANVEGALLFAGAQPVREVGLFFGRRLLRGNRSRKMCSARLDAFDSPNCLPLAELGVDVEVRRSSLPAGAARQFFVPQFDDRAVAVLSLHPGVSAGAVDAIVADERVRGLILASYGVGNGPHSDAAFTAALARAAQRGVVIANTSQCPYGGVSQQVYASGAALAELGVLSAGDMTPEAAFAKLHVLLAGGGDGATLRADFMASLCGERDLQQ